MRADNFLLSAICALGVTCGLARSSVVLAQGSEDASIATPGASEAAQVASAPSPSPVPGVNTPPESTEASSTEPPVAPKKGLGPYIPPTKPKGSLDSLNDTRRAPELNGVAIRAIGVRAELAEPRDALEGGGALYERGLGVLFHDWFSARYVDFAEIGADTSGLRYRVDLQLAAGPQLLYDPSHAIFARIGARAEVSRASGFYASAIRAPELQIGHHSAGKHLQLDLAAHGSYVVLGHVIPAGPKYTVGGAWAFGGYVSAAWSRLRLDAEWSRLEHDTYRSDELRAHACVLWSDHAACADGRLVMTQVTETPSRAPVALFVGVAVLLGQFEWL